MPGITIVFGVILIVLGLVGYFGSGRESPTALIPAAMGVLFVAVGFVAGRGPGARKHAMHVAAVLALVGFVATVRGLIAAFRWMGGTVPDRPQAVPAQAIMAVLCLIFLILCVRSFVAARRNRQAGAGFEPVVRQ